MPTPWTVVDAVTVVLAAATVILTGVAILVAVVAFWGYRDIRKVTVERAEAEARRIAEDVAAREMRAFLDKASTGPDISVAYQDKPQ